MSLATGHRLSRGRYEITGPLARGGMGTLYLAIDHNLDRVVVVKENEDISIQNQEQFQREAMLLADLSHANLPRVTDHFIEPSGRQYLVMDYIEGRDLREICEAQGEPLDESLVLEWLQQVTAALAYMHGRRNPQNGQITPLLHRDIKPANIKCTPNGRIVLVDFGLAKVQSHTGTGTAAGARGVSTGYSPLEQYMGGTDVRSDIYALGATVYKLLTLQTPPAAPERAMGDELTPPRQFNKRLSEQTERVILRAMELRPTARYQSIEEMRVDLFNREQERLLATLPVLAILVLLAGAAVAWTLVGGERLRNIAGVNPLLNSAAEGIVGATTGAAVEGAADGAGAAPNAPQRSSVTPVGAALAADTSTPTSTATHPATPTPSFTNTPAVANTPLPSETPVPTSTPTTTNTSTPTRTKTPTPVPPKAGDVKTFGGIDFVYVPGGTFTMGSITGSNNERPVHEVSLPAFWIMQTEVTNAQFSDFVAGDGYSNRDLWTDAGWAWREENSITEPAFWTDTDFNGANHPVVGISWYEAVAYANWLSRKTGLDYRLPTEAEWEKAARGTEGLVFPWGNEWDPGRVNYCDANCDQPWEDEEYDDGYPLTAPVGKFEAGGSPYNALDMAGNVWEWTSTIYDQEKFPYPYQNDFREAPEGAHLRVLRGGSWNYNSNILRSGSRGRRSPDNRLNYVGFRLMSPGFPRYSARWHVLISEKL